MKKILILTYRYPFINGPHCSSGQNIFYAALKRDFTVAGICFGNKDPNDGNFIAIKRESNNLSKVFNLLLLKSIRLTHYRSKAFKNIFNKLLITFKPDIIFVEHTIMTQYIRHKHPNSKFIFYDDESTLYVKANQLIKTLREKTKNLFVDRAEIKAIINSDIIYTISEQERDFLKESYGSKIIEEMPYSIDTSYYYNNWKPNDGKLKILFLGDYGHYPNVEAVKFISRKLSVHFLNDNHVEFIIVGRNVKKIGKYLQSNMRAYEDVRDVREFYWTSTVFIAPIFYGGGLRIKILEAAACGIPIVMSTLANNGFGFKNKREVFIADSLNEYIGAINFIKSLETFGTLFELSFNANLKIKEKYSKEIVQEKIINNIKNILNL